MKEGEMMKGPKRRKNREPAPAQAPAQAPNPAPKGGLKDILVQQKTTFLPSCRLEIMENKEATMEGCRGVLEYDENCIKLSGEKITVRFLGQNLYIRYLTGDTALVEGIIASVDFSM